MNKSEQKRFDKLYRKHPRALKLRRTCQRTKGGGECATETGIGVSETPSGDSEDGDSKTHVLGRSPTRIRLSRTVPVQLIRLLCKCKDLKPTDVTPLTAAG